MARALSELLERIRPAGAPGAPTEGERPDEDPASRPELALVAEVLADFVAEASAVRSAATAEAAAIRHDADLRIQRIRQQLPDRVARAEATSDAAHEDRTRGERSDLERQRRRDLEAIDARAEQLRPVLAAEAVELIWHLVLGDAPGAGSRR
ncbi:MAG: hypothetical protein R2710_29675 [Acidimicrobiales bacterium]